MLKSNIILQKVFFLRWGYLLTCNLSQNIVISLFSQKFINPGYQLWNELEQAFNL